MSTIRASRFLLLITLFAGALGCEARFNSAPPTSRSEAFVLLKNEGPKSDTPKNDRHEHSQANSQYGQPSSLPRPSSLSVSEFEEELFQFLKQREYIKLGWLQDKSVRDTGPYMNGVYYGTHPAVRVFYSPGIISWLTAGRVGPIPDGEMIIKEQYAPPAARHDGKSEEELQASLESWTVMVKDASGSHDGWFWSNPGADAKPFDYHAKNQQPYSGFGMYCIRCHASTLSPWIQDPKAIGNEFTFAALRNIEGFPGDPLIFRVDDSWRNEKEKEAANEDVAAEETATDVASSSKVNNAFSNFYNTIEPTDLTSIPSLPASSYDSVPACRDESTEFVTADQCMHCHAGLTGPLGPVGFVPTDEETAKYGAAGVNVSPYGEWRWTPMGLAGRDPVFYAQLESEVALIHKQFGNSAEAHQLADTLVDTCLRCHGAMGHQQFHSTGGHGDKLKLEAVHAKTEIGALSRDGISCMVCHRLQPRPQDDNDARPYLEHFLETSITGNLHYRSPKEIFGPYKDKTVSGYAMQHGIGVEPKHSDYIQQSQLCGTCHTVSLPTIDNPLSPTGSSPSDEQLVKGESVPEFKKYHHHIEQATYLEWLNSEFNNETNPTSPTGRSCQNCHMPDRTFADETGEERPIRTRIAAIQDTTYPEAENLASHESLHVKVRDSYRRHGFAGLNIWLIEYFKQFDSVLGVKKNDYMTGSDRGAEQAIAGMKRMASEQTATIAVDARVLAIDGTDTIEANVTVTNMAGHRFPTGVGFRRAFIEFRVLEETAKGGDRAIWASGRTNQLGVILGEDEQPLPTEFFDSEDTDEAFQPHHAVIHSPNQVQIYETLLKDNAGRFTTSFVRGCETVKDNRLLPRGWTSDGPGEGLTGAYLAATHPGPVASLDADFVDGHGSDTTVYRVQLPPDIDRTRLKVTATLYYQATPPYYLDNLFKTAPTGNATRLLHSLTSHVDLDATAIANWKLRIASATAKLSPND